MGGSCVPARRSKKNLRVLVELSEDWLAVKLDESILHVHSKKIL